MGRLRRLTVTPTVLNADAYDSGDVLFNTTEVVGGILRPSRPDIIRSIVIHDKDDQGIAMTLVFLRDNPDLGTLDAAPDITDAESLDITGFLAVAATDYLDLGGVETAFLTGLNIPVEGEPGGSSFWIAATTGGTPTHTTGGLVIDLYIEAAD